MKKIAPLKKGSSGEEVANLHLAIEKLIGSDVATSDDADAPALLAQFGTEREAKKYAKATARLITLYQRARGLAPSGNVDVSTAAALNDVLEARGLLDEGTDKKHAPAKRRVLGAARSTRGTAPGLKLRLVSLDVNGKSSTLKESTTDARGRFEFAGLPPDGVLQIQIVLVGAKDVPLTRPKLLREASTTINVAIEDKLAPDTRAEFSRLIADIESAGSSLAKLAKAEENDKRRDLSLLKGLTGWDARLLAIAAYAARLGPQIGIEPRTAYAMIRAGTPPEKGALLRLSAKSVAERLTQARDARLIDITDAEILAQSIRFNKEANDRLLVEKSSNAVSTGNELLAAAGLSDGDRAAFIEVLQGGWKEGEDLWKDAAGKVSADGVAKLRVQGRLGFLTSDNAPLIATLMKDPNAKGDLAGLADSAYYKPERWTKLLSETAAATGLSLDKLVPEHIEGPDPKTRAATYARVMASEIRRSFPTRVMAAKIAANELTIGKDTAALRETLMAADAKGFVIGRTPVASFFKANADVFPLGTSPGQRAALESEVKRLHRLYQVTPDDATLETLAKEKIGSSNQIASFSREEFSAFMTRGMDAKKDPLAYARTQDAAEEVHANALQVDATSRMTILALQQAENPNGMIALGVPQSVQQAATAQIIKHFPTLDSLFGNQNYCECEHCRSVLSPGAYLVDLLRFIDPPDAKWTAFQQQYRDDHGGAAYPHTSGGNALRPIEALRERRPDIMKLALTCENTHTALPYVDLVNEILENYMQAGLVASPVTGDSAGQNTPDLIAEPQKLLPAVYDTLRAARYPMSLPFDLWTAATRAFCDQFRTPFWQLLDTFRPHDGLFDAETAPRPYNVASVLIEKLSFAKSELTLLANAGGAVNWFELYGFANAANALAGLDDAKKLAGRLKVSYRELAELVSTQFVNPALGTLGALQRLGVAADTVFRYKSAAGYQPLAADELAQFQTRLAALSTETGEDVSAWLEARWAAGDFDRVLLLRTPPSGCDPSAIRLVYPITGNNVDEFEYLKLNVFVRLWRRLGWKIAELDAALMRILGTNSPANAAAVGPAVRNALTGLAHLQTLSETLKVGKDARVKLLTLWGDLPTYGAGSLYAQLFLAKSAGTDTRVFDRVTGPPLPGGPAFVVSQLAAVQAATGVSSADIQRIFDHLAPAAPLTPESAPLTLANVSLLYRYALLAGGLKMTIGELIDLKEICGIDPFAPPPAALDFTADNVPGAATLRFVRLATVLRESGLRAPELRYLLLHENRGGDLAPRSLEAVLNAIGRLEAGLAQVRAAFAVPTDITAVTSDDLRQRLTARYPEEVAATFVGMLDGTTSFTVTRAGVTAPLVSAAELTPYPELQASFDGIRDRQHLACSGVIGTARLATLKTALPALATLLDELAAEALRLFTRTVSDDLGGAGPVTFADLFDGTLTPAQRIARVIPKLYPKCQEIAEARYLPTDLATLMGAEEARVAALARDEALLADPPTLGTATPLDLVAVLRRAVASGVEASYFADANLGTPNPLVLRVPGCESQSFREVPNLSAADTATASGAQSIRFRGYLRVPATGTYRFEAVASAANEGCMFAILGQDTAGFDLTAGAAGATLRGTAVELTAGVAYPFTAELRRRAAGSGATFGLRGDAAPTLRLLRDVEHRARVDVETVGRVLALLDKVLLTAQRCALTDTELAWFLTHKADFGPRSLNDLPTAGTAATDAATVPCLEHLARLARFVRLRRGQELSPGTWHGFFAAAHQTVSAGLTDDQARAAALTSYSALLAEQIGTGEEMVRSALAALEWDLPAVVTVAAAGTGKLVTLTRLLGIEGLERLIDVVRVSNRFGVRAAQLRAWATPFTSSDIAAQLRGALKARYSDADWRGAIKPLADDLRRRRRSALVAYIMDRSSYTSEAELYEQFLVDPGMEPVVKTSRIRLALASTQLFINRALTNLEARVHPSAITARHWDRMRIYRVWEAARKFLLFPNWLEPEFRDDQSHLFKTLMGALLQGNVDRDSVEDAFFQYLQGLDQIARLEMMAMYADEEVTGRLHVIGRTYAAPHKYFYRRFSGSSWSPWEPVGCDIDGDHLVTLMWRGRLCLFWLTVIEQKSTKGGSETFGSYETKQTGDASIGQQTNLDVRLNWCEYVNGEWLPRATGGGGAIVRFTGVPVYRAEQLFVHGVKRYDETGAEDGVELHVLHDSGAGRDDHAFLVRSRHAPPELVNADNQSSPPYGREFSKDFAKYRYRRNPFTVSFFPFVDEVKGEAPDFSILEQGYGKYWILPPTFARPPNARDFEMLTWPLFYEDHYNTFFVLPRVEYHSMRKWEHWGIDHWSRKPEVWREPKFPIDPRWPEVIDPREILEDPDSIIKVTVKDDWVTTPGTLIRFGDQYIGADKTFTREELVKKFAVDEQGRLGKMPRLGLETGVGLDVHGGGNVLVDIGHGGVFGGIAAINAIGR